VLTKTVRGEASGVDELQMTLLGFYYVIVTITTMAKLNEKPFPVEFKDTYLPDFHEVKKGLQIF